MRYLYFRAIKKNLAGILLLLLITCLVSCNSNSTKNINNTGEGPKVLDEGLELSLFAENPDIVTPIGITIDSLNNIYVLESHTHQNPEDYSGPEGDQIKIMKDENRDGKPDKISVFAEGFEEGMNIEISPAGHLYLVTSSQVWIIYDRDKNGVSEEQKKIMEFVKPDNVYAHAALMGITFSNDGWMYISRGNVGSAGWQLQGSDGSTVSGYGDGGNIIRARPDGTNLEEVATGFWNPFDLKFDKYGRLLVADNDPDSRGPNRLVHIIRGGDYGYQSIYGGSGIHPYLAWNGELPGTLPYAVGLGEAPSGLLNADLTGLPHAYKGQMLCAVWEESRIVSIDFFEKGVSVGGNSKTIIEGDKNFRPVAFAADTSGNIYFTDWVKRVYPVHGQGKIWKLSAKENIEKINPGDKYAAYLPNPKKDTLEKIYEANTTSDFDRLKNALKSSDAFLRNAAIEALTKPVFQRQVVEATNHQNPDIRLGAMIALHRAGYEKGEAIARRLMVDPDIKVRKRALKWIGQQSMTGIKSDLDKVLEAGKVTPALFKTYLATVRHLNPEFVEGYKIQVKKEAKQIPRELPQGFIASFIKDPSRPDELRALAVKYLDDPQEQLNMLLALLKNNKASQLQLEIVRTLGNVRSAEVAKQLIGIAKDSSNTGVLRSDALLALSRQSGNFAQKVIPLLDDKSLNVQVEAARYLWTKISSEGVREALVKKYNALEKEAKTPLREQIALALSTEDIEGELPERPGTIEAWKEKLAQEGDPLRGRRVFYSLQSTCASCHMVNDRGADLGPDLTNAGQSKSREQLIHSILKPSDQIAPRWQGWFIRLKNGTTYQGRQINVGYDDIDLYIKNQETVTFEKDSIEEYGMMETSLMPPGLESRLSVSDMRDLVSFLEGMSKELDN